MEVQRLFGENLEKPNHPEVKIRQLGESGKYAVIWGGEILLYDYKDSRTCTIKKLTDSCLAFLETTSDLVITGDNDKQLIVLQLNEKADDFEIKSTYLMRRRIADVKAIEGGDRLVTADKFGDIHIRNWEELTQVTMRVYQIILRHMTRYPQDEAFIRMNQKYIDQMKAQNIAAPSELDLDDNATSTKSSTTNPLVDASEEDDDPFADKCLANHLATITKLHMVHLKTPKRVMDLLVSCDKDEKVRVSQCPDVHIIERIYCGHDAFVTDVMDVNTTLYTLSADRTLKSWDLATVDGETNTWKLSAIPFKFITGQSPSGKLYFTYCASKTISNLDLNTNNISDIELPDVVLEASFVEKDSLLWIDQYGKLRIRKGESNDVVLASFSTDQTPLIHRHWKHTQEDSATTTEERLAKRRRHKSNLSKEDTTPPNGSDVAT